MITRHATEADIPNIVNLLKVSLGEALLEKSEAYWRWKHLENPFGESPVLLSLDGERIVGVRAFMQWQWKYGDKIFRSIRAVDTATHPNYQGKGIFKKLTLALLDDCRREGIDLVYNTPNSSSKPGYLKMGWKEAGQLPINFAVRNPFAMLAARFTRPAEDADVAPGKLTDIVSSPELTSLIALLRSETIVTNYSAAYFQWRYAGVPVVKYAADRIGEGEKSAFIFYRIKPGRFGRELRLTDLLRHPNVDNGEIKMLIRAAAKKNHADYITISNFTGYALPGIFKMKINNVGPTVTIRDLNLHDLTSFRGFSNWRPSLGDLELF